VAVAISREEIYHMRCNARIPIEDTNKLYDADKSYLILFNEEYLPDGICFIGIFANETKSSNQQLSY
jgi:hypothetical protein